MSSKVLASMRQMAWSRAKGELHSIESAMWPGGDCGTLHYDHDDERFGQFSTLLAEFIKTVEDEGLAE
jgi:hypothetical protein